MAVTRITCHELPGEVRARVEGVIGTVDVATSAGAGLNSAVAARLETAAGTWFVKALPPGHRWVWTQEREATVGPYLRGVAPEVVARIVVAVTAFASAQAALWAEIGGVAPEPWVARMGTASARWARFRSGTA